MAEIPTIGEMSKGVQGYPTTVWVPAREDAGEYKAVPGAHRILALLHDRRGQSIQNGAFFIPGNNVNDLVKPGSFEYRVMDADNNMVSMRVPDAVLWENHGGPCEESGAKYRRVSSKVIDLAYARANANGGITVISHLNLRTQNDYMGPFDIVTPQGDSEKAKFVSMSEDLLTGLGKY